MMQAMPFRSSPCAVLSHFVSHVVVSPPPLMRLSPSFGALTYKLVDDRPLPTCSGGGGGVC